jgi:single-strand DNA-binding protein
MKNLVILIGNLGADPEVRYLQDGTAAASFTVATTERWKGKDGQMQEATEWHRVTAWRRLAEICGEYLAKGSRVYIEGKLQTRKWEKDGVTHYTTEIVAREMKLLSPKQGDSGSGSGGHGAGGSGHEPPPMESDVPF